eukprot:g4809.t1
MVHADLSHLSYNDNIVHVSSDKGCHVFRCPRNGMRIAYIPHAQASKLVIKRLMESGSQLENIHQLGGAHALEHFMYKDGEAFSRFNGADLNAWTTTKHIGTHFAGPNHMLDRYLDHQHETMQGEHVGNITQGAFDSEINNIIDEMKRNQAPSACVRRLFEDVNHAVLAQGNTTPTIGLESTLRGLSLQGIKDMQKALMGPSRNFMTIVGSLPEGTSMQDLVDKLGNTFGTLEKNKYLQAMPKPHLRQNSGIRMHEIRQQGGSTMLAMGWPSPAYCKDSDVLNVISAMVSAPDGASSLSKPFQDAGVFYQSNMEANAYTRPDATVFLAAVPASTQNETQQMMRAQAASFNLFGQQLPNFSDGAMLKQTLKRMRNEYHLKTTGDAMQVADSALEGIQANGQPSLSWHYNDRFADNAITCADVQRVAREYLNENDLIVLATMTLGNSFNGRLMSEVRDKMGLTYGIGAQVISNGSFPSLCVSGTFNKNVLQRGVDATNNILGEFSSGKISDGEIETARESMLNMIEANGMNKSYVLRRIVDELQPQVATDQSLRWHTIKNASNDSVRQFVTSTLKPGGFKCTVSGTY